MMLGSLNYWPILIAAIASFAFGAAWYMALSRQWMAARGLTEAEVKARTGPSPLPFVISFVALLVMALMLAGILQHLARGGTAMLSLIHI